MIWLRNNSLRFPLLSRPPHSPSSFWARSIQTEAAEGRPRHCGGGGSTACTNFELCRPAAPSRSPRVSSTTTSSAAAARAVSRNLGPQTTATPVPPPLIVLGRGRRDEKKSGDGRAGDDLAPDPQDNKDIHSRESYVGVVGSTSHDFISRSGIIIKPRISRYV